MKKMLMLLCMLGLLGLAGPALGAIAYTWDAGVIGDNEWSAENPAGNYNWDPEGLPVYADGDTATISDGYAARVDNDGVDTPANRAEVYQLNIGVDADHTGTLVIGEYNDRSFLYCRGTAVRVGSTLTLKGGMHQLDRSFSIAGTYNLEGGNLEPHPCGPSPVITGLLNQTGGYAYIDGQGRSGDPQMRIDPTGTYKISGGKLWVRGYGWNDDDDQLQVDGAFHVSGSGIESIDIGRSGQQTNPYRQTGTLICDIDVGTTSPGGNAGITVIEVTTEASFAAGSILDVDLLGAAPNLNDQFLLMTAETITHASRDNLSLHPEDVGTWEIVWGTGSDTMSVKYVPEPATLALVMLGGIGVLLRRRR